VLGLDARPRTAADGERPTRDDLRDWPPALACADGYYTAVRTRRDVDGSGTVNIVDVATLLDLTSPDLT